MTVLNVETFFGKYLGFSPTDESNVGLGEMEMTIGPENIVIRMATGLKIQEDTEAISEFEIGTPEEALERLTGGESVVGVSVEIIIGELRRKGGALVLTFIRELEKGVDGVMMTGTMADLLGPTFLFSQAQVDKGVFDQFLSKLEEAYGKDQFPRLANNGKAKSDAA